MKTETLKELGLTQEQINVIMAENGKDVNNAKGNLDTLNQQIENYKQQITDRDNQLNELKKSVKDNESLTKQIADLQETNKNSATEFANKLSAMEKAHAVENAIRDAKALNIKAVMANLDLEKVTMVDGKLNGLTEQLESLKKGEDTSFLFGNSQPSPSGTEPRNPNNQPQGNQQNVGLSGAIAKALAQS